MKGIYFLLSALCCFSFFVQAESPANPDLAKAEKIYKRSCATCHGKSGEKPAMGESKIINQLNAEEISSTLFDHKSGKIVGAGNPAKQRLSDEEIHALSEFIPDLK